MAYVVMASTAMVYIVTVDTGCAYCIMPICVGTRSTESKTIRTRVCVHAYTHTHAHAHACTHARVEPLHPHVYTRACALGWRVPMDTLEGIVGSIKKK